MKHILFALGVYMFTFVAHATDNVAYTQKKRLLCEVTSLRPAYSDFFVGDLRDGWLRIIDDQFYSIEIGGWVVMQYSRNDGETVYNDMNELYIKDYHGSGKLDKRSGKVTMNFSGQGRTKTAIQWLCRIGVNQPNSKAK